MTQVGTDPHGRAGPNAALARVEAWFCARGWSPFEFQREAWAAYLGGRGGLIHAPTGTGKTHAAWLGPVLEGLGEAPPNGPAQTARLKRDRAEPLRVVWITPLRALATDTVESLLEPVRDLGLPWTVEKRTGDTGTSLRARQRERLPTCLVTTPESASVLLSYPDSRDMLGSLQCVVVDEWHELLGSKRGVQTELVLARLRAWNRGLRTWGLSATLANIEEAADVLLGPAFPRASRRLIRGLAPKRVVVDTVLPADATRFPWAGHLGLTLLEPVLREIERAGTTLLFTNTRSQAESWFRAIVNARPEWLGTVALHHGSLDRALRDEIESRLHDRGHGEGARGFRCVVCTSSLDLGVDFEPVDQVIQIGSPKGAARLLQRAGRSGHQPGALSRVVCVPSHAFELVEFAAARSALERLAIEERTPRRLVFDVLVQHLVTVSMGGGFEEAAMRDEVRSCHAFHDLTDQQWSWAMDFVRRGGPSLVAYPRYSRVVPAGQGDRWIVAPGDIARRHRMNIGTITADTALRVQYIAGRTLGTIEEGFIARLRPGDRFAFAGRVLELVRVRDMTAYVRRASGPAIVPTWDGGKMPLSSRLCEEVRARIDEARQGRFDHPEMEAVRPLLERQRSASAIPARNQLLIELTVSRQGHHAFLFPFAGRLAHEALGSVLAHRLTRLRTMSVTATATDYGIELLTGDPPAGDESSWRRLLSQERLLEDLLESLNATELARRQFRDVARVAGLIFQAHPGERRPARLVQASSSMFYEVFTQFDPGNLLLEQARRDMLEGQLEVERLRAMLRSLESMDFVIVRTTQLTPFAFPLWAESMRSLQASSEAWQDRVRRMALKLEKSDVTDAVDTAVRARAGRIGAGARPGPARARPLARAARSRFGRWR